MSQRKVRIALATALVAVLATSACTRETKDNTSTTGSHAVNPNETYYWISAAATQPIFADNDHVGWKAAAKELGVKAEIAGPTTVDMPGLIAAIDQICAQKPAGVAVVGWDPSETASVNKCIDEGVPAITVDGDLPASKRLAFVGTDWYQIGVQQANAMIKATGGHGKVATLSIINADIMRTAQRGFADTISGTGLTLVANEDDAGDQAQAASKTASLLAAHPDLAGIAGFDTASGPGIVTALTEAHKLGQVKVTAMEQEPPFFKNVKDGNVQAIIVQKRKLFTYYGLKILYDYNHNGLSIVGLSPQQSSTIPRSIDTGLLVVTKDNVDAILASLGVS